jgi:hypothetical protein
MSIGWAWLTSLVAFGLLHFVVVPAQRRGLQGRTGTGAAGALAWHQVWCVLRTVALALWLGTSLLWAAMALMSLLGTTTVEQVTGLLVRLRSLQEWVEWVDLGMATLVMAGLATGLTWLTYKQAQQKAAGLLAEVAASESQRVIESHQAGQWEALAPTETMTTLEELFNQRRDRLGQAEESGSTGEAERLNAEMEELRGLYLQADAQRRMRVELPQAALDELTLPPEAGWKERLRQAVFNRGVLKTMTASARGLAFVGLVLLVPAAGTLAVGLSAEPMSLRIVQLEELRVQLGREAAERQLALALRSAPPAPPVAGVVDDEEAEAQLAATYDRDFNEALLARAAPARLTARIAQAAVRDQILTHYARSAHGAGAAAQAAEGHPHLTAAAGTDDLHVTHPLEDARQRVRERLATIRRDNTAAWQQMKAALPTRADFATGLTRTELRSALGAEVMRAAFAGGAQEMASAYEGHAAHYMSELASGQGFDKARAQAFTSNGGRLWTSATQAQLHAMQQHADADGHVFDRALREHPPTLHAPPHTEQQVRAAQQLLRTLPDGMRDASALYGFGDLAPGHYGAETRTAAAKVAQALDGNAPGGGKSAHAGSGPSKVAFNRSFSYSSMRGFSRVGGVLIGRPPESASTAADVRSIRWSLVGADAPLRLELRTVDGRTHSFGPYAPSVVRQALTYAADQRPLTVTMITAEPVPDLKIITHPALLDTPIGCRAVALDRVTDEATSRSAYREQGQRLVQSAHGLYRAAWGQAMRNRLAAGRFSEGDQAALTRVAANAVGSGTMAMAPNYQELRAALQAGRSLPLTAKPQFYLPAVVEPARRCVASSASAAAAMACLEGAEFDVTPDKLVDHYPQFQIWSGVRELPYTLDPALNFLRPQPGASVTWPFDFVLQVAFSRRGLRGNDEIEDKEPWEFPEQAPRLVQDVATLVRSNPERAAIVAAMRDFAVLQRLFRAALEGHLGPEFPAQRLAMLARELNALPPIERGYKTPRWNTRPIEVMFAREVRQRAREVGSEFALTDPLARDVPETLEACARARPLTGGGAPPAVCDFRRLAALSTQRRDGAAAPPAERQYATDLHVMLNLLELRRTLGVHEPENAPRASCPALM